MPLLYSVIRSRVLGIVALAATTLSASAALQPRDNIVILGDSITADGAYGQFMQDLIDEVHPDHLARVITRGVHGDTARGAYARMELDVTRWRPDWVVINLSHNDLGRFTTDEFLIHYERLINRVLRDTRAALVIVSPIYQDRDRATENPRIVEYVAGLRSLAKKYRAAYAPVYEETKRLRPTFPAGVHYAVDGAHPNDLGYWIYAQTILRALDVPLPAQPRSIEIPARRTVKDQSDALAGTRFTLDLPMPLEVNLTAPPPPEAVARKAAKPVVIDGKLDDWDLADPLTLGAPHQLSWSVVSRKRDHHAARAWFAWDDDALYFAIQVDDSQVRNEPSAANIVDRDCVEFALDARTASEREAAPYANLVKRVPHVAQYIIAPAVGATPASVGVGFGDKAMSEDVSVASTITSFGYQIEARIPIARFAAGKLAAGDVFPIDVTTINLDRGDRYLDSTSFRWTGSKWSAFNSREYGRLTLR